MVGTRSLSSGALLRDPLALPTLQIPHFNSPFTKWKRPPDRFASDRLGDGALIVSTAVAQRRALFILALTLALGASRFITEAWAAGAFAVGKCGAYGQAYDYAGEAEARAAALKQCKGDCTALTMKRACAALSVDMTNPCGAHGYAVKPSIATSLNAATRECYRFGGKECVIRAWACDAKG
jgi:hypothetical protein